MKIIWYLLRCPEGKEENYVQRCQRLINPEGIGEVVCFKYQRMLRYGGGWHFENRILLPGYIFVSEAKTGKIKEKDKSSPNCGEGFRELRPFMIPCKVSCLKVLCSEGNLIGISRGIIRNGIPFITQGPLKDREHLIQKIDRHKRTAEIEIQLAGKTKRMVVGLEIYEKQE